MKKEEWRSVVGYEGIYEISSFGKLRRLKQVSINSNGFSRTLKEYIFKTTIDRNGYSSCRLLKEKVKEYTSNHRLVAKAFIENPENKPCVNHIDGNRLNNKVSNLEWATHKENTAHAKNVLKRKNYQPSVSEEIISFIRDSYGSVDKYSVIKYLNIKPIVYDKAILSTGYSSAKVLNTDIISKICLEIRSKELESVISKLINVDVDFLNKKLDGYLGFSFNEIVVISEELNYKIVLT